MKEKIVLVENLVKSYSSKNRKVDVLKGINLFVIDGEILAIMGRSGSGKTTLLNCISALDSFDSGKVLISGVDINKLSDGKKTKFRAKNIGFIFQSYNLIPVLSSVENVELPLLLSGKSVREARKLAIEALERIEMKDYLNSKPSELSGGQQQRVAVARAICGKPKIIFADEPTGNLDSKSEDIVLSTIKDLSKNDGLTFVIVTHSPKVSSFCDRIVRIEDGVILD